MHILSLVLARIPQTCPAKLLSSWSFPCVGLFLPRGTTWHFPFNKTYCCFSLTSEMHYSFCDTGLSTIPSQFASSVPLSKTLMKMLNSMSLWGSALETGLQLDLVPLITVLWAWHFCQFQSTHLSVYLSLISLLCLSECYWSSVKNLTKINVNSICCSPLIHQISHLIVDSCQVG